MAVPDLFTKFEAAADQEAHALCQDKALRSVITLLHLGSFVLSQNQGYGNQPDESSRGEGVARIGYLLPLITNGSSEFKGASALDALGGFGNEQQQGNALSLLYGYGELCELAPFVHRGAYTVEGNASDIELKFRSEAFANSEIKDTLVANLFQPFTIHDPHFARAWFDAQVPNLPTVELAGHYKILQDLTAWFIKHSYELSPLSEEAMLLAVGVGLKGFRQFSAACMAVGQFHMSMADAVARRSIHDSVYGATPNALEEQLEWLSPCYKIDYVQRQIAWLAGLELTNIKKLMAVYATSGEKETRGEGFSPPFITSGETYFFSPLTIRHMMSSRNVLYSLAKQDQKLFNNVISTHMEPQLIKQASVYLSKLKDVVIRRNVIWDGGEIDILVYRPSENVALVIEAKGAIAPEGARMIYNMQSRINEGITQLRKFVSLPEAQRDAIFSQALGISVREVQCKKALLSWTGFGTDDVWSQFTDIAPLNIALLAEAIRRDPTRLLMSFVQDILAIVDEIIAIAKPHWEQDSKKIGKLKFERPILKFDENSLVKYRQAPHL